MPSVCNLSDLTYLENYKVYEYNTDNQIYYLWNSNLRIAPNNKIYFILNQTNSNSISNYSSSIIEISLTNKIKGCKIDTLFTIFNNSITNDSTSLYGNLPKPIPLPFSPLFDDTFCANSNATIHIYLNEQADSIQWYINGNRIKTTITHELQHVFDSLGNYNLKALIFSKSSLLHDTANANIHILNYPKPNLGNDTILCPGKETILKDNNNTPNLGYYWNTQDTTESITVNKTGNYILTNKYKFCNVSDTIKIEIGKKPIVFIGNDTSFCYAFSKQINAGMGFKSYQWNTGDTNYSITVNKQGIYHVKVADNNYCENGDTIDIRQYAKPKITLMPDTILCDRVLLSVIPQKGINYLWSNADTGSSTQVYTKGSYWVRAQHPFCYNADTIMVDKMPKPYLFIGNDTIICNSIELKAPCIAQEYLWSTGEWKQKINVRENGIYWLRIKQNNCFATDTIILNECKEMRGYIPTAFSPNFDGTNDEFVPYIYNSKLITLIIYNRWGELIYEETGNMPKWDGKYKGQICQDGVYLYKLIITDLSDTKYFKNGTVNLMR